jgi:hypothetical protein
MMPADPVPSAVYLVQVVAGGRHSTHKITFVR